MDRTTGQDSRSLRASFKTYAVAAGFLLPLAGALAFGLQFLIATEIALGWAGATYIVGVGYATLWYGAYRIELGQDWLEVRTLHGKRRIAAGQIDSVQIRRDARGYDSILVWQNRSKSATAVIVGRLPKTDAELVVAQVRKWHDASIPAAG